MPTVTGKSSDEGTPGVLGESEKFNGVLGVSTANGHSGVAGVCDKGNSNGVYGRSKNANGVVGYSSATGHAGVAGANDDGEGSGVYGRSSKGAGVHGESKGFNGVLGATTADGAAGVAGVSDSGKGNGIYGRSKNANGVVGYSSAIGASGVAGVNEEGDGPGVYGRSKKNEGVHAETMSTTTAALAAYNLNPEGTGAAIYGKHTGGEAIHAETNSPNTAAIAAYNLAPNGTGAAVYAKKVGSIGHAGFFDGDVHVTHSITVEGDVMLLNADCAEEFTVCDPELVQPGAVMVISQGGVADLCNRPYDHRALGVVSGAGEFRPALLLDRQGGSTRRPIALMGKVFCQVDAGYDSISPGDLLTTSATPGHAMRASNATLALGAVIGKALAALKEGRGMIPILAILQ